MSFEFYDEDNKIEIIIKNKSGEKIAKASLDEENGFICKLVSRLSDDYKYKYANKIITVFSSVFSLDSVDDVFELDSDYTITNSKLFDCIEGEFDDYIISFEDFLEGDVTITKSEFDSPMFNDFKGYDDFELINDQSVKRKTFRI